MLLAAFFFFFFLQEMNSSSFLQVDKSKSGVGKISRLFSKKPSKKNLTGPAKPDSYYRSNFVASSHHNIFDESSFVMSKCILVTRKKVDRINKHKIDSNNNTLTRHTSVKNADSLLVLIQQQRHFLNELDIQKSMYSADVIKLQEQLVKTHDKIKQKSRDKEILELKYRAHLRSLRFSEDDDIQSIAHKLRALQHKIHVLVDELLPHAEPIVTSEKLSSLWVNLQSSIQKLGVPLTPTRIQMLTEKFIMDVLVQNLNISFFPGLSSSLNKDIVTLQQWFEKNNNDHASIFSTQLRQEIVRLQKNREAVWKKSAERNWHHVYKGLQKAYPAFFLDTKTQQASSYSKQLRELVEYAMALGSSIKGHEVCITAVDVREGKQPLDLRLMEDVDGQTSGIVAFCVSPPFIVRLSNRYEPLIKGRVLCFSK